MPNILPTPAILIDEVCGIEGGNGRGLITLSNWGTPLRLTLSRNALMKLGHMATKTASELMLDDGAEVVKFPGKKARKRGKNAV